MLRSMPHRVVSPILAFLAAALLVTAALLPEYELSGTPVTPLDSQRAPWLPALGGVLVYVALILLPAMMLLMGDAMYTAGGILIGAGAFGVTRRLVRVLQLGDTPDVAVAIGSWMDVLATALALAAGVVALMGLRGASPGEEGYEDEEVHEDEPEVSLPRRGSRSRLAVKRLKTPWV